MWEKGVETKRQAKAELAQGFAAKAAFGGLPVAKSDSPHLHIVVLFLLQLHITGRHFFYSLYINKLHNTQNLRNLILALILHDSQSPFPTSPDAARNYPSGRNVSIFREMFKGTERYFNVPSGVSEYMP